MILQRERQPMLFDRSSLYIRYSSDCCRSPCGKSILTMLLTLPYELVEAILAQVDNPGDLAPLSATCRELRAMISPAPGDNLGQLQCRHLAIFRNSQDAWKLLTRTPKLARGVRRLCILGRRVEGNQYWQHNPDVSYSFMDASLPALPSIIRAALMEMRNLRFLSVHIRGSDKLVDWSGLFEDVCTNSPQLEELHLTFRTRTLNKTILPKLDGLRGLRALGFAIDCDHGTLLNASYQEHGGHGH
ncbi:hypothetical protein CALCODRAFT_93342 [Calocera cornea HHB12733]|uniref:F-box domain-containing protein n=1 Tax=Calocera cornea HHB12733 TaxID=1353952 RepID=A0A165D868_9BASI|nr:hypothetical protein CALCODRAFT_93342 [Calocera cornea HHB12733]